MAASYSPRQFGEELRTAAFAPQGYETVRALLDPILREAPLPQGLNAFEERQATAAVAQRIDTASSSPKRYLELATDLGALLQHLRPRDALELAEAVAERHRVAALLEKYLSGVLSRTSFLSFVSEQRWPTHVKDTVLSLDRSAIERLRHALMALDLPVLRSLLLRDEPREPNP